MRRPPIADLTVFSISIISSVERFVGRLAANPRAAMTMASRTMMRPSNSLVVGDLPSLINDLPFDYPRSLRRPPHKDGARIAPRIAKTAGPISYEADIASSNGHTRLDIR